MEFQCPVRGPVAQHAAEGRRQCCVLRCPELVAPTMWCLHMDGHLRGVLPGAIPDSWLMEQGLSVCHSCVKLVSPSHLVLHQRKCSAQHSTILAPVLDVSSGQCSSELPSLDEVCSLRCPTIHFVPNKARQAFAQAFSAVLMAVISENTVTTWLKLSCFPSVFSPVLNVMASQQACLH